MDDFIRLITLSDPNTRTVLLGTALLGLSAGVVGCFAILRKRALVGDALAHAALPGICLAWLVVGDRSFFVFMIGAFIAGVAGVLCITGIQRYTRIKADAATALVLSVFFGFGIVLSSIIQKQADGNKAGLDTYLFGKAATIVHQDVVLIAWVSIVSLVIVALLFKEFRLISFDLNFGAAQGWPVFLLDLLMMLLLCACTIVGLPAVGVVLMAALLIIPGAAARYWTDRLVIMVTLAGFFGMMSCFVGTGISAIGTKVPTGPAIVLCAACIFFISLIFAPKRGILTDVRRRMRQNREHGIQHVLRGVFEICEPRRNMAHAVSSDELLTQRTWSARSLNRHLARAVREGLLSRTTWNRYSLTEDGLQEAARVVRAHRLWERFLLRQPEVSWKNIHSDADEIEHVLDDETLDRIERQLVGKEDAE